MLNRALAIFILLAVFFWPWCFALLDLGWYLVTGHQVTVLAWWSWHGVVIGLYPVFVAAVAAVLVHAFGR